MNWDLIITAVIAATPPSIVAWGAYTQAMKAHEQAISTHLSVNSRMDELLKLAKLEATAQATLDEKAAQTGREAVASAAVDKALKAIP